MMGSRSIAEKGGIVRNGNDYVIARAISEIPGLSHAAPEWHPRGTLSSQGPLDARGIFCFLV